MQALTSKVACSFLAAGAGLAALMVTHSGGSGCDCSSDCSCGLIQLVGYAELAMALALALAVMGTD